MSEAKHLRKLIHDIDREIDRIHSLVLKDFNDLVERIKEQAIYDKLNEGMGAMVRELQYYEIIRQKLEHIKAVHTWVYDDVADEQHTPMSEHSLNVFRLNYLQVHLLYYDYLHAIRKIQSVLNSTSSWGALGFFEPTFVFNNCSEISGVIEVINAKLLMAERLYKTRPRASINQKIQELNNLYSMECERGVLLSYLQNPAIDRDVLIRFKETNKDSDESVELF